jgi:DNA gyrase subunit B
MPAEHFARMGAWRYRGHMAESAASAIDFINAVRKRPGMYIGDVHDGSGLHHLVWELIANVLDQVIARRASRIELVMHADGSVSVTDDGPGFAAEQTLGDAPLLEAIFTRPHDTPTADGHAPHLHVGLRGVGVSVVCALCERVEVEVWRGGSHFRQRFARGQAVEPLHHLGPASAQGTRVRILPDAQIFQRDRAFDAGRLQSKLRELSFLLPGLRASFAAEPMEYGPAEDLTKLLEHLAVGTRAHERTILCAAEDGHLTARVALRWDDVPIFLRGPRIWTYCNLELTRDGGTHELGFKKGVAHALDAVTAELAASAPNRASAVSSYGRAWARTFERLGNGLQAVVAVTLLDPSYDRPTKSLLASPEATDIVARAVEVGLAQALVADPQLFKLVFARLEN